MTTPQDAPLLAALEIQYSALGPILARVTALRSQLASATPVEWQGQARRAFEAADHAVGLATDTAEEATRRAYVLTGSALRTVVARG
ncbi:hypothetical protein HDC94_000483 [Leifsonia sp. AK011]|uniref:hypothetical protein n=1 Tax=Leifsonia sp. AK011 TaxID=2723075 RepID=UPI0015C8EFF0|nr:hypothetical protein [Leifsonia sp. AK011]NYF09327.1 hypothetical protein [Leifsonia sp. AK011]